MRSAFKTAQKLTGAPSKFVHFSTSAPKTRVATRIARLGTETAYGVALAAAELANRGRKVYPFHIGDLNFKTPQCVIDAAKRALDEGKTGYCPAAGIMPLRKAIAESVSRERGVKYTWENVSVQPGGKPVITKFLQAIMNPGEEVLYPSPGYPIYESQIRYLGGVCKPYTYRETSEGFTLDIPQIESLITRRTAALVHNNWHNPMGVLSSEHELSEVARIARERDLLILSDEPYSRIVYPGAPTSRSLVSMPGMLDRSVILYTFSKSYAMTGWRLGAAIGPKWIIDIINKLNTNDEACTTHFVQWAGVEALTNPQAEQFIQDMVKQLQGRRDTLVPLINQIPGFSCKLPHSTFYLLVNVTEAMQRMNLTSVEEFRQTVLENTGVSFCTREHFGESLPNETNKYVRFAYSGIHIPEIIEACHHLKNFMSQFSQSSVTQQQQRKLIV